ncbi:MAG: hypothetical protein ACE5NJ_02835, partial [Thermodesulfobacteriota bacterium]
GFLDRFEINTVLFDPSRVTVNKMVGALKRANTYIVLLRPVVTEVHAREASFKVYPNESFYLPSDRGRRGTGPGSSLFSLLWKRSTNDKRVMAKEGFHEWEGK